MGNTIRIDFPVISTEQAEIYIADLSEINFHAFEESNNILSAYIREEFIEEKTFNARLSNISVNFTRHIIKDVNWNQKWEDEFAPVIVDSFVAVRAAFHAPINTVAHEIIITPKMSFGTGHHATTFLMLQQMQRINFKNKDVLDFGTGTGILAILASKCGAGNITAIDNDEWSIENARENFVMNNCDNIHLFKNDVICESGNFDVILANINLNVIMQNLQGLKKVCKPGTNLLLSGFLLADEKVLSDAFIKNGFICNESLRKENWVCSTLSLLNN